MVTDDSGEKGYTVKDRRFSTQNENKKEEQKAEKAPESAQRQGGEESGQEEKEKKKVILPPVDFSTFIFSLNTSALVHLGEMPEPGTGKSAKDLVLAKHTIDMIAMLKEKTQGNLTKDEQDFIEHILYDLRMRYIREA